MKRVLHGMMAIILLAGMVGGTIMDPGKAAAQEGLAGPGAPGPRVVVATPMVKMDKKAKFSILGAGFTPGQEVRLLFTCSDGVKADIGYALKPAPVANKVGAWATTWNCGRFISKKLIKEGASTITVTDTAYNVIAHAPVAFYKEKAEKEKK